MSEDPPTPRHSLRPSPERVFGAVKFAATVLVAVGGTLVTLYKWVEQHVTETELAEHERPLLERVRELEEARREEATARERDRQQLDRLQHATYERYWYDVGDKAAEFEPDPRKRARAADRARDRFDGAYREGMTLEDAFRRALARGLP